MIPALLILGAVLATTTPAQSASGDPLDQTFRSSKLKVGPVVIGEDHPIFDLADFSAAVEPVEAPIEARWVEGSVKWVRAADGLAVPLARLRLLLRAPAQRAILLWRDRAIPFQSEKNQASVEILVPLLERNELRVELDGKPAAKIRASAKAAVSTPAAFRHAIDHSCSPWNPVIRGLDDAFISMNCRLIPVGRIGSEEVLLNVHWMAAGVTLPDGSSLPMLMQLRGESPAQMTLIGPDGKSRVVEISATAPSRWHRLRLAAGVGPYDLSSSAGAGNGAAGSVMLYGNFRLHHDDDLSIRGFEAAVSQSPSATVFFNNLGFYFAYDLSNVLDGRLQMVALLGLQGVTFADRGLAHKAYTESLFPQGFEFSYIDAFGMKNERLVAGVFLYPGSNTSYQNYWLRFGRRYFWELNYIYWRTGGRYARMSGVSIGIPFAQFF